MLFSLMFSSTSYAEWAQVTKGVDGNTFYVDFDRIRKVDGYVYYWGLTDYLKPYAGAWSVTSYSQVDCNLFRAKFLAASFHSEPMGKGTVKTGTPPDDWIYPPNSNAESALKFVCDWVK